MEYLNEIQSVLISKFPSLGTLLADESFNQCFYVSNIIGLVTWILTLITNNYSQIDRLWSVAPCLYAFYFLKKLFEETKGYQWFTSFNGWNQFFNENPNLLRLVIMTLLVTVWACRLTFNAVRRGYYKWSHEDYRWVHVKKMFNYPDIKWKWHLFNLCFIAFFQSWLLLGFVLPLWKVKLTNNGGNDLNSFDLLLIIQFLVLFLIEWAADEQQETFQKNKKMFNQVKSDLNAKKEFWSKHSMSIFLLY
jgi:steroid 5-alpha reductase family enzyme